MAEKIAVFVALIVCCTGVLGQGTSYADIKDFPYFITVEINGEPVCAATLIDDKWVVTLRTCVQNVDVGSIKIRGATSKLGHRGQLYYVTQTVLYNGTFTFFGRAPDADLALVKVATSFRYVEEIQWLDMAENGLEEVDEGKVSGWGGVKTIGSVLQSAKFTVMSQDLCNNTYRGIMNITDTMYCIYSSDGISDPCIADLGAPLYSNYQFYGIVTHNPGCGNPNELPVVATSISSYTSWVITILSEIIPP